ncbi:MAG: ABC transporter substrate-binding protein [Myxococcota bacterium]
MSRNLTVQIAIAVLLGLLLITTLIQLAQFNAIESHLIQIRQQTGTNATKLAQLEDRLSRPQPVVVAPSGGSSPSGTAMASAQGGDEGNILKPDPTALSAPGANQGGELRLPKSADSKGFNRLVENGADIQELYRGLVGSMLAHRHVKEPGTFASDLALSCVPNAEGTVFHIKLRPGVMWHKPAVDFSNPRYSWLDKKHEVTTADFEFMIQMLLDTQVQGAAPMRVYFEAFDRLEILGPYEMKVHWKEKYAKALSITLEYIYPLPRWLYAYDEDGSPYASEVLGLKFNNHWYNDRAIGTGPFRFVENKPGEHLKLERHEGYYLTKPALEKITYTIIKENELRLLKFKRGELDLLVLSPNQYKREILDNPQSPFNTGTFKYDFNTSLAYYYLGWNGDGQLFNDKRVRRAMTQSFNRAKIVAEVFHDLGTVVTGGFHKDTPWYDNSIQPYPFDLDKARALLNEAGWTDTNSDGILDREFNGERRNFEFTMLIYNSRPEIKTMMDIFKTDLLKVGVKMSISPIDWPAMQKKMDDKDFDAFTGGWGLDWEPDPFQLWHSSQADVPKGSNRVGFRHKEADQIIEESRRTTDLKRRQELFYRLHAIHHDEQPYTFFYTPRSVIAWNPAVHNLTLQGPRPQILFKYFWKDP